VWVMTDYVLKLMLLALEQAAGSASFSGPFSSVWVGLLINPTPNLTDKTKLADVTEATFTGYVRQLVVWYPPFISAEGPYLLEGHSQIYTPLDGVTPNNITGVMLCDKQTGGNYLCGMLAFPTVYPLSDPTQSMVVDPEVSLPLTSIYGGPDLSN
jgi:hypothetical protein